jgi:methyl-accepting chemotaxis protein
MDGGHSLGTLDLFAVNPPGNNLFPALALAALLGLVLALLDIGWLMGRYVVRQLDATSRAARRIAAGNLGFDLPVSRVKEVAEVRAAFEGMGAGLRESIERKAELEEERRFFCQCDRPRPSNTALRVARVARRRRSRSTSRSAAESRTNSTGWSSISSSIRRWSTWSRPFAMSAWISVR